jgi:hypothetical protein
MARFAASRISSRAKIDCEMQGDVLDWRCIVQRPVKRSNAGVVVCKAKICPIAAYQQEQERNPFPSACFMIWTLHGAQILQLHKAHRNGPLQAFSLLHGAPIGHDVFLGKSTARFYKSSHPAICCRFQRTLLSQG